MKVLIMFALFPFFLYSIVLHEVAHGVVALRNGDPTAKLRGRITLNPIPHIDPMGLLFFILSAVAGKGFGWARPVPINPGMFRNVKRGLIEVSLAGVAANLLIAVVMLAALRLVVFVAPFLPGDVPKYLAGFFLLVAEMNFVLAVFNLIPIPPLDGSRVVMGLLPDELAAAYARLEPFGFILLLGFLWYNGFSYVYNIADVALRMAARLIGLPL